MIGNSVHTWRTGTTRRGRRRGFTLIEILIVVTILGILAGLVMPYITNNTREAKSSSLLTDLHMVRQQLELFKVEHSGQYPKLAQMWDGLIAETDASGNAGTGFGPYLRTAPLNQFTGGSDCAGDNSADWQYEQGDGKIRAVVPADFIVELGLSPADVVAAP